MENNKNYMKGFVPYAIAAAILSLCGGFTASVPTAISTAWDADSSLTFITLAYSLAAAAMAPILGKLGGVIGRRKMLLSAMGLTRSARLSSPSARRTSRCCSCSASWSVSALPASPRSSCPTS